MPKVAKRTSRLWVSGLRRVRQAAKMTMAKQVIPSSGVDKETAASSGVRRQNRICSPERRGVTFYCAKWGCRSGQADSERHFADTQRSGRPHEDYRRQTRRSRPRCLSRCLPGHDLQSGAAGGLAICSEPALGVISSLFHSDEQLAPFQIFAGSGRSTSWKVLLRNSRAFGKRPEGDYFSWKWKKSRTDQSGGPWLKEAHEVSDRALRYRAHACPPPRGLGTLSPRRLVRHRSLPLNGLLCLQAPPKYFHDVHDLGYLRLRYRLNLFAFGLRLDQLLEIFPERVFVLLRLEFVDQGFDQHLGELQFLVVDQILMRPELRDISGLIELVHSVEHDAAFRRPQNHNVLATVHRHFRQAIELALPESLE
jgi:hypothetical protein